MIDFRLVVQYLAKIPEGFWWGVIKRVLFYYPHLKPPYSEKRLDEPEVFIISHSTPDYDRIRLHRGRRFQPAQK